MQNHVWNKGLVLGIIIIFLGTGVFPNVCGKLGTLNTNDNTLNNSTTKMTFIVIGLITNKTKLGTNNYAYMVLIGYIMAFYDGKFSSDSTPIIDSPLGFAYSSKIGIFSEHVVCAVFFNCYFPCMSKLC